MVLWVVHELEHCTGDCAMEHLQGGGSPPAQLTLGTYTTLALARAAVAMRVSNLFAGGDCFTATCPAGVYVTQSWAGDGTGEMVLGEVKQPPYIPGDNWSTLTLSISTQEVDLPPPLDQRPRCWDELEDAAGYVRPAPPPPPPPTVEEAAALEAALAASYARMGFHDW
jgi:hypothetical protein